MANTRIPPGLNPRDRRPGERRTLGPGGRPTSAVWYVLGFLFLMALAQMWFLTPTGQQVGYSEFKQLVRSNQVAEVTIGEQTIHGLRRGEGTESARRFSTTRI